KEETQLSAYRYLLMKKDEFVKKKEAKNNSIRSSRALRYIVTIIVTSLTIVGALVYTLIQEPPKQNEDGSLNITTPAIVVWVATVLIVLFTVPFSKVPPLLIGGFASLVVIPQTRNLRRIEKEIRQIPNLSYEP